MKLVSYFIAFVSVFLMPVITVAQPEHYVVQNIPALRQKFHDDIDKSQLKLLQLNCNTDSVFIACKDVDVNLYTTYLLKKKIDYFQYFIETDKGIEDGDRYKLLRGVNDMLQDFILDFKIKNIEPVYLSDLINAYQDAMQLYISRQSIKPVIEENDLSVGKILLANFALQGNAGIEESKPILVYKLCKKNPEATLKILTQYPNTPNADSLIIDFAYLNPEALYDYAASNTNLGKRIRGINEPLIQTITEIASVSEGRFLFPFLDEIIAKKITIDAIRKTIDNEEAYYKLLIKTHLSYEVEKQNGKRLLAMDALVDKLKAKALETYITPINALHDEQNLAVRFAKIQNLTPVELYYLTVMGEEELYTSSFISGVYPKIIEGLGNIKSDSLFRSVHYAYYRKFIKMCAGFNMLENFLGKMDKPVAVVLMKSFANDLEQYWSLEEAVDVADSYSSINDSSIKKIIADEVKLNLAKHTNASNKKGKVIYGLLNQIFTAFDSTGGSATVPKLFALPNVNQLNNSNLRDAKGRIYVQQFFYGDKDGKNIFESFISSFRSNGWKIISKSDWVEVISVGGTPITIFANRPLNEEEGLDDAAQRKLYNYLDSLSIYPTIAIHRGHSYYVKASLQQITAYAKLVLLGSCGGYHNLDKVLNISPQAQIIASKQIGTGVINMAMIDLIMENLKQGKDLYWTALWKQLENKFTNRKELKERFDDYIPPQKNLGAIFIMAYYKAMDDVK